MSTRRSDIKSYIEERTKGRRDWPSDRYLAARFASRVAAQLEQLRAQQRLSYDALADRAGTSKAHVIRLLSGTYDGMTTKSMAKLASALRCEIDVKVRPLEAGQRRGRGRWVTASAQSLRRRSSAERPARHGPRTARLRGARNKSSSASEDTGRGRSSSLKG